MADPLARLRRFLRELKRRNAYRVAVAYLVSAFVAIQAADLLVPETTLPAGVETFVIYVAVVGFPIALVLAWAFELTPDGVRRTPTSAGAREASGGEADASSAESRRRGQRAPLPGGRVPPGHRGLPAGGGGGLGLRVRLLAPRPSRGVDGGFRRRLAEAYPGVWYERG